MNSKLWSLRQRTLRRISRVGQAVSQAVLLGLLLLVPYAHAGDAPAWMRALVNTQLPTYDDKTEAVLLYSEDTLTVQSDGKLKSVERRAYKILRPDGKEYGTVKVPFDAETRITGLHGWCIPASGKDYEVKDKDSVETSLGVDGGELVTDVRLRVLEIPAADPGNIVGYEVERENRPYVLQDDWEFQHRIPVREAHYILQLPAGWEYKTAWLNHAEVAPTNGNGVLEWVVRDVKAIRPEDDMPPWRGLAGSMLVSLLPPNGAQSKSLVTWNDVAAWYMDLARDREESTPEIKQKVAALTAGTTNSFEKMRALARFAQSDVRYVAIELGIGGYQPHPAAEIFTKRFGDCKDKVTLLGAMLKEIGLDSYYVLVDTDRGAVSLATPPSPGFNHAIIAIKLPAGVDDSSLMASQVEPKLGAVLFFDPTDFLTPFGELSGELQGGYALLAAPDGGMLVQLPQLPANTNGLVRTGKFSLDPSGTLTGDVHEVRLGDRAAHQRYALRSTSLAADRIKPIETALAESFATYRLTKASMTNFDQTDLPFEYHYSLVSPNYAKTAADLLMVRPRVLGEMSSDLLETKDPRQYPVEFDGPERDTDTFEITLPPGYQVDDLPNPIDLDYPFASYHSKTEVQGNTLRYTRTFEVKQLSVPLERVSDLKKLYRIIATDEQSAAVLKPAGH